MSNFNKAKFVYADLSGANLSRSLLTGAVFENSTVLGVSFENVIIADVMFIASALDERQQQVAKTQSAQVFADRDAYRTQLSVRNTLERSMLTPRPHKGIEEEVKKRKNRYDVFYGTNRTPIFTRGTLADFDGNLKPTLSYGVCEVIVPEGHKIGSLGSPLWKRLFNRHDDRLRLESLIPLNDELFWSLQRETSGRMKVKERPTIFVHGFNTTFQQAVLRAAQIGYDLGLGQGIGLFSWPSKGSLTGYSADEASSEASKYVLAEFIEQFVNYSEQGSANIVAHSMGCRIVLGALEVLSATKTNVLKCLNQVVLAAADVDTAIMPHLGVHAVKHSTRTTSYVSDRDTALKLSGWLHRFPRVGVTPPTFVLNGMDTIHVNNLDLGEFAHGYLGASRTILNDIFSLLSANSPPDERHAIEAVSLGGQEYWRIKD
jgi:esterase/lipase superfamily enzyme